MIKETSKNNKQLMRLLVKTLYIITVKELEKTCYKFINEFSFRIGIIGLEKMRLEIYKRLVGQQTNGV